VKARVVLSRDAGGYAYEVLDERGVLRCAGWSRGNKNDARTEALEDARKIGLEVR
jgi:hypothetical protein